MASVASLEEQVAAALRRMGLSGNDSILVLGVSGGSDSSALLYPAGICDGRARF